YYDKGEWKEKKITPDEWQINYAVKKRRAGKAPEGSGVPVGTEYHWYILAHQNVTKLNANDYSTSMTGVKFKLAHKRAGQEKWSSSPRAQRKRLIQILRDLIQELEKQAVQEARQPTPPKAPAAKASQPTGRKVMGKKKTRQVLTVSCPSVTQKHRENSVRSSPLPGESAVIPNVRTVDGSAQSAAPAVAVGTSRFTRTV